MRWGFKPQNSVSLSVPFVLQWCVTSFLATWSTRILFACLFILVSSCADSDDKTGQRYSKIYDIQRQQQECLATYEPQEGSFDEDTMISTWNYARAVVEYQNDGDRDHWQTSCETTLHLSGDCEDLAIFATELLRQAGFADDQVGIIICDYPGQEERHVFAAAYPAGRDHDLRDWLHARPRRGESNAVLRLLRHRDIERGWRRI